MLNDALSKRGISNVGYNSASLMLKINGHSSVDIISYEPDPITFRSNHYYNSSDNILYTRVVSKRSPISGIISAYWKRASYD